MNLKLNVFYANGLTNAEIQRVKDYCNQAHAAGRLSREGALIVLNGSPQWVCRTIAEIMDQVRPGCWLKKAEPSTRYRYRKADPVHAMDSDHLVKVYYRYTQPKKGGPAGEYLWARRRSATTAQIESIPFLTGKLAKGDLVAINNHQEVIRVLEHVARTVSLRYQAPKEWLAERYAYIQKALKQYDIYTEGMTPGVCALSVPKDVDDQQLKSIAKRLNARVTFHKDEFAEAVK